MFDTTFFTLSSVYFLALLSPGQDFFLILKHALSQGYQKAWWSVLGIASGNAFYIVAAYAGHELLSSHGSLMRLIEILGALFLIYLGCLLFFAPRPTENTTLHVTIHHARKLYAQGLFSALLNPKNVLFYFSLLFTILPPETSLHVKIFYALWMVGMLLVWDLFVAWLFGNAQARRLLPYLFWVQKMIGIGLFGFGTHLLVQWVLRR
jgi:threonine/homoserine/homoserine lactone efflux protein